jgi:hypothetical protein
LASTSNPSSTNTSRGTRTNNTDTRSSARLEGGGKTIAPSGHTLKDYEEFELVDYAGILSRQEAEVKHSQRQIKRAEKLSRLDEADEMKFSHSIQFNAVPDWSSHYIAYSKLKQTYVFLPPRKPPLVITTQTDSY